MLTGLPRCRYRPGPPAEDRLIVTEIAVAGERHPVVEQPRDIMFEMRVNAKI